ncbi:hypothetical protein [Alteromonas oceanisediminis]|uniref:hypothetical protein n=1 Tax=Alteromonas oceanisediminis TaxID=2836180 RepID=UPI001BDAD52D|nr:hypothetical protein [Alteromonas oceanisediminis]MBT0586646.1 hypothetical protein [Alteromonas oceanisediminis]
MSLINVEKDVHVRELTALECEQVFGGAPGWLAWVNDGSQNNPYAADVSVLGQPSRHATPLSSVYRESFGCYITDWGEHY